MNNTRTKLYAAVCVLFGSAAVGAPWTAAHAEQPVAVKTVKFADLNLQTPEGAKTLYNRIRAAAKQVCDANDSDPILREAKPRCIDKAIDGAVRAVDAPYLTALRFGNGDNVRLARK